MSGPSPDPSTESSPDLLTPAAKWLGSVAVRIGRAMIGQTGINVFLGIASAIGMAGGVEKVAPYIKIPAHVFPFVSPGVSRVLFVYESAEALRRGQIDAIFSNDTRMYLDARIPKAADGKPGWRCWDKDVDVSSESPEWRAIWADVRPKIASFPATVVVDKSGKVAVYGVPDSPEDLQSLINKFGDK